MYAFKIACWALIFIFRLRFPPGVSIVTILKRLSIFLNYQSAFINKPLALRSHEKIQLPVYTLGENFDEIKMDFIWSTHGGNKLRTSLIENFVFTRYNEG